MDKTKRIKIRRIETKKRMGIVIIIINISKYQPNEGIN
jgi:hypothetical protein